MAANYYHPPNFGYNPTWTPPRLPLTPSSTTPSPLRWPSVQHTGYPTQPLFPPMPPTQSPPPPPPQATMTPQPQRSTTTSPQSHSSTPPPSMSQIQKGYPVRICEIPAMPHWKQDADFHDTGKANGIDFPSTVRSSKFTQFKDIEGMDPLQISSLEVSVPRPQQHMATTHRSRTRRLHPALRQHRDDCLHRRVGATTQVEKPRLRQVGFL